MWFIISSNFWTASCKGAQVALEYNKLRVSAGNEDSVESCGCRDGSGIYREASEESVEFLEAVEVIVESNDEDSKDVDELKSIDWMFEEVVDETAKLAD